MVVFPLRRFVKVEKQWDLERFSFCVDLGVFYGRNLEGLNLSESTFMAIVRQNR